MEVLLLSYCVISTFSWAYHVYMYVCHFCFVVVLFSCFTKNILMTNEIYNINMQN